MGETYEKDFFLNPDAALDEGFKIKKNMYKVQDLFDRATEIERKLIALTETIPAEVRCNELIESCETSIRGIEKSDFAEYGERIDRNIKTLEMESTQSVNKLKEKLASSNDKLDQVISIAEELSSDIQYEKYDRNILTSNATSMVSIASAVSTDTKENQKQERLFEIDEINTYLNFLMSGRHESTSITFDN